MFEYFTFFDWFVIVILCLPLVVLVPLAIFGFYVEFIGPEKYRWKPTPKKRKSGWFGTSGISERQFKNYYRTGNRKYLTGRYKNSKL